MGKLLNCTQLEIPRFGEFARQYVAISSDDIAECLEEQKQCRERIGQLLVRRGLLLPEQVSEILRRQARWAAKMRSHDIAPHKFPIATPFSLCMPCYNEQDGIEEVLTGALCVLPEFLDEFEIVVVDDGSKDATSEILGSLSAKDSRIRMVRHEVNRGYGAAVTTALRAAQGHWICFTDGDGQFNLLDLPQLIVDAHRCDVVVGYRYQRAEGGIRRLNAHSWNWLIRCLLGVQVRDLDCAFKLFPRWVIDCLQLTAEGACISAEILTQCVHGGLSINQVPVNHFPRSAGQPTGANLKVVAKAFCELPRVWKYRSISRAIERPSQNQDLRNGHHTANRRFQPNAEANAEATAVFDVAETQMPQLVDGPAAFEGVE